MGTHPLSFAEVLEDEYRYFHGEIKYEEVRFETKHVREIEDLEKRLDFHRPKDGKDAQQRPSRWTVLAAAEPIVPKRVKTDPGRSEPTEDQPMAVRRLNGLLTHPELLADLWPDKEFRKELLSPEEPEILRSLLRVPGARRTLFELTEVCAAVTRQPGVIDDFGAHSAAIRVLKVHAPQIFAGDPALLALIADDEELAGAILTKIAEDQKLAAANLKSSETVNKLQQLFPPLPTWTLANLARQYDLQQELTQEEEKAYVTVISQRPERMRKMREILKLAAKDDRHAKTPPAELSRFNAILIEVAYWDYVCEGQSMRAIYGAIHARKHAALCLSGGGIRSATFNLGVLQGMADHRMLNRFQYISTVSGGGYIGSWLSSWVRRHNEGATGVAKDLSREPTDPLQPEVEPIRHLREYSSYLAPRATAFSLDSWTLVATYLRNLLLNWTMLLPALAAALAMPRLLEITVITSVMFETTEWWGWWAFFVALFAVLVIGLVRPASELPATKRAQGIRKHALWFWLGPLIVSAFCFCTYWAGPTNVLPKNTWIVPLVFGIGGFLSAEIFMSRFRKSSSDDPEAANRRARIEVPAATVAGAFAGWLLVTTFQRLFPPEQLADGKNLEIFVCLSVPAYLLVFFAQSTLLVGLTTEHSADYDREWWARSAAAVLVFCILHAGASFAVLLLPVLIYQFPWSLAPVGGLSGLGSWLLSRKSKDAGQKDAAPRLMPLLRLAATVTVLFLVAVIAMLTSSVLGRANQTAKIRWTLVSLPQPIEQAIAKPRKALQGPIRRMTSKLKPLPVVIPDDFRLKVISQDYFSVLRETRLLMLFSFLAAAMTLAWFMARRLNVNIYSMHGMYRNRLIRAYLGASRWIRTPDPFTGFDPQDNIEMWNLRPHCLWQTSFINFEQFAADLDKHDWWTKTNLEADGEDALLLDDVIWGRDIVKKFNDAAPTPEEQRKQKNEAMAAVVYVVNDLMRCYDLQNNVPAPRTVQLLASNRKYLETEFKSLKSHRHMAPRLDSDVQFLPYPDAAMPQEKTIPDDLRKDAEEKAGDKDRLLDVPPLHVVNAALNLVAGDKLAWQERQAAPFTITPLHSGSRMLAAYRDTAEYGEKISLGTAMAISGAAVSPNMGALSSPAFTFLMTLFNARLGWWIGNPARETHNEPSPRMSLVSLLREALGKTDASHDYVFLSDGGHFENLGLYEMVLRRCKYIIVCDASADGRYGFGDLANAIRKIRIDLGIPIEPLVTKYIGPQKDERYGRYCALGKIRYSNVDAGDEVGYLVYIKPAIYSDSPADVRNYANESTAFPHETTADQFFSESQFESYRALGRYVIGKICGDNVEKRARVAPNVPTFFANAWVYVNGAEPPVGDMPITNVSDMVSWMGTSLGQEGAKKPAKPKPNVG